MTTIKYSKKPDQKVELKSAKLNCFSLNKTVCDKLERPVSVNVLLQLPSVEDDEPFLRCTLKLKYAYTV